MKAKRAGKRTGNAKQPGNRPAHVIASSGATSQPIAPGGESVRATAPTDETAQVPASSAEMTPINAPASAATAPAAPASTAPDAAGAAKSEPAPPRKKRRYNLQREDYASLLARIDDQLQGLEVANPLLRALLAEHGVTAEVLAARRAQYDAAQAEMSNRIIVAAAEASTVIAMNQARHAAEIAYGTFRQTARVAFPDRTDAADIYLALQLTEAIPEATTLFVDRARLVLQAAQCEPIAGGLAAATFDAVRVADVLAAIEALDAAYKARRQAHAAAVAATRKRNDTVRALRRAMRPIALAVSAVLRLHPTVNRPADW